MLVNESKLDSKSLRKYTAEELEKEFNYLRAEQITRMMLSLGFITQDEYHQIMAENKATFPTFLSAII